MSESVDKKPDKHSVPRITLSAAVLVLILAVGAAFFPHIGDYEMCEVLLVYKAPVADEGRDDFYQSLALVLGEISNHSMKLMVAGSRGEFLEMASSGVDFVFCPDGMALDLKQDQYSQMAVGRRKLPSNLRPRGVMVYRNSMGAEKSPWVTHPQRTVFGDSLSLVAVGGLEPVSDLQGCVFGPDPYDHAPVLHALRLGAFDFALVRQWDADAFFVAGLLDPAVWGVKNRTVPVPDVVLMASTDIPLVDRLKWGDTLALAGRSEQGDLESSELLADHLGQLGLAGFNILLEPDFELVRRNFPRHWPVAAD